MNALLRRRPRARLVWLTLFVLLFQQLALAAHGCDDAAHAAGATVELAEQHCGVKPGPAAEPDALCAKHCAPDRATAHELAAGKLPALPPPAMVRLDRLPAPPNRLDLGIPAALADPPPLRRFCSLLI
jgi:hypothetical protein